MELILASTSPRRQALLEQMGVSFRVVDSQADETVVGHPAPAALVKELSARKAYAVQALEGPDPLIIAADTVVALDGAVLGKPSSTEHAMQMLQALSGRKHQVYTGLTVLRGETCLTVHEETDVKFRPLTQEEITCYLSTGEPMDKAGAYGIQGYGALFVEGIRGDYYNVMGLPVCRLGQILRAYGIMGMGVPQ